MAAKSLLLATLFLAGLAAQGSEAKIVALVYGEVPCSSGTMIDVSTSTVFPNASVNLVLSSNVSISGTGTTTNRKGQFMIKIGVTSRDMLVSLASNRSKVVVTTPPAACNPALPAAGTMTAPVRLHGSRRLSTSATDNLLRDLIGGGGDYSGGELRDDLCALITEGALLDGLLGNADGLLGGLHGGDLLSGLLGDDGLIGGLLSDDGVVGALLSGLLYGDSLGAFAKLGTGSFSYSA